MLIENKNFEILSERIANRNVGKVVAEIYYLV